MQGRKRVQRKKVNRRYKAKVPSNKSLNQKIHKIQNMIELKKNDAALALTQIGTGGTVFQDFCFLGQGTGEVGRIGTQISPTSLQFRCSITASSAVLNATRVRMIVFWDRQPNGAAPTIFDSGISGLLDQSTITNDIQTPYNYDMIKRFTVLYDKVITLNPQVLASGGTTVLPMGKFLKKKIKLSRQIKYNGSGTSIAALNTNALCIAWMCDQAGATNASVECSARLYYKDA